MSTDLTTAANHRQQAELAIDLMLSECAKLFPKEANQDWALAWQPHFLEAIGGFSAAQITSAFADWLATKARRRAPSPVEILEAVTAAAESPGGPSAGERTGNAAATNLFNRCQLCGATRDEHGTYASGELALYRDAGPKAPAPWLRRVFVCWHGRTWLAERNAEGWLTLSQLPAEERYRAVGMPVPGTASPMRKLLDSIGNAMEERYAREARR